jgi:hypothetical protein
MLRRFSWCKRQEMPFSDLARVLGSPATTTFEELTGSLNRHSVNLAAGRPSGQPIVPY